jgi:hypothetical protein
MSPTSTSTQVDIVRRAAELRVSLSHVARGAQVNARKLWESGHNPEELARVEAFLATVLSREGAGV